MHPNRRREVFRRDILVLPHTNHALRYAYRAKPRNPPRV
jgi:hypothetical protein